MRPPEAHPRKSADFPPWLKVRLPVAGDGKTRSLLAGLRLATVCQEARCPNQAACYQRGTATFLILGENCTRGCTFCAVRRGAPAPLASLAEEAERVAEAAKKLGLRHVVITSVTRDDLPDEGAEHFARVVGAVRRRCGAETGIEVLVPDFHAREECLRAVVESGPEVFNHNLETVARLYPEVRPQARYERSLEVLRTAKRLAEAAGARRAGMLLKSGLMVGLGERPEEVREALRDLRAAGCEIATVGQYLSPSRAHHPVAEYVRPEVFDSYRDFAMELGFRAAACAPLVRSSYRAGEVLREARGQGAVADR